MSFITIAGEQLIAQKQGASQVLQVAHFVLANIPSLGVEPADRIEALPPAGQIVDTKPVTRQGYVNANQVAYSLALDSTVGDYDFNWVGLKSAEGVLVACEHIALTQKRKTAGPVAGNNLTRNFLLAFSGAVGTTAITVPAETWQIDFTTRLFQIDDRDRLGKLDDYGPAAFFGDGFKVTLKAGTVYTAAAGLGYVGGIRCEKATATDIDAVGLPKGIWMDVSLQGDINGVAPVIAFVASSIALADNTDGLGFKHYLFKIADIAAGGVITDLRQEVVVSQPEAEEGTAIIARRWNALRVRQAARAALRLPLYTLPLPVINTAANTIPVTATAKPGTGGAVALAAGVKFSLCRELAAGFGITDEYASVAFSSPDLDINANYFLRCTLASNNAPLFYVQKGVLGDATPASLKGTANAAAGGGFYSTPLDMCIAQVITGAANTAPKLRLVMNRKTNRWNSLLNGNGTFFLPLDPFVNTGRLLINQITGPGVTTQFHHGSSGWFSAALWEGSRDLSGDIDFDGAIHAYPNTPNLFYQKSHAPYITNNGAYAQSIVDMKVAVNARVEQLMCQAVVSMHQPNSEKNSVSFGVKNTGIDIDFRDGLAITYVDCQNSKITWEISH